MKIDKRNKDCCYNDKEHMYWDNNTKKRYTSVTTLIGKYQQPFDEEFWSGYKAIEKLLTVDQFKAKEIKADLRKRQKINLKDLSDWGITEEDYFAVQQEFKDAWEDKRVKSCERGTAIHAKLENEFYTKPKHSLKQYNLEGEYTTYRDNYDLSLDEKGVYPEFLIYFKTKDEFLMLAGQSDLVVKDGNDIYIIDYKTNEKIEQKSFYDSASRGNKVMLYPMNSIMDSNYWHYTLQLSTYAYMIKKQNPNFNIKGLMLIHYDHAGNPPVTYELEYMEKEVIKMLKYTKRRNMIEYEESLRNPII